MGNLENMAHPLLLTKSEFGNNVSQTNNHYLEENKMKKGFIVTGIAILAMVMLTAYASADGGWGISERRSLGLVGRRADHGRIPGRQVGPRASPPEDGSTRVGAASRADLRMAISLYA